MYREFMVDIKNEVDRENQIITELLTLVRMDRKDSKLNVKECSVNKMVELILHRIRPIAQKRDIELTLVSMREVYAEIDEVKMTMVITNLVENAVKYNRDHGKVRVTINADPYNFYVSVEDTGVGIPKDSLDKIYERFYRVDKSRSREVGGTGLGLSITKSIVLQHHGAIDVQSILGEGTKFTVTCPLTYVAHPVELRRKNERKRSGSRSRNRAGDIAAGNTPAGIGIGKKASAGSSGTAVKKKSTANSTAVKKASAGTAVKKKSSENGTAVKKTSAANGTAVRKKSSANGTAVKKTPAGSRTAVKKKSSAGGTAVKKTPAGSGTTVKKKSTVSGTSVKKDPNGSGTAVRKKSSASGTAVKKTSSGRVKAVKKTSSESGSEQTGI